MTLLAIVLLSGIVIGLFLRVLSLVPVVMILVFVIGIVGGFWLKAIFVIALLQLGYLGGVLLRGLFRAKGETKC